MAQLWHAVSRMRLGNVLRKWRRGEDLNIRDVASQIGMAPATLSRVERGEDMQGEVLAKILRWLLEAQGRKKQPRESRQSGTAQARQESGRRSVGEGA